MNQNCEIIHLHLSSHRMPNINAQYQTVNQRYLPTLEFEPNLFSLFYVSKWEFDGLLFVVCVLILGPRKVNIIHFTTATLCGSSTQTGVFKLTLIYSGQL